MVSQNHSCLLLKSDWKEQGESHESNQLNAMKFSPNPSDNNRLHFFKCLRMGLLYTSIRGNMVEMIVVEIKSSVHCFNYYVKA